jgi:hypothetical protein
MRRSGEPAIVGVERVGGGHRHPRRDTYLRALEAETDLPTAYSFVVFLLPHSTEARAAISGVLTASPRHVTLKRARVVERTGAKQSPPGILPRRDHRNHSTHCINTGVVVVLVSVRTLADRSDIIRRFWGGCGRQMGFLIWVSESQAN